MHSLPLGHKWCPSPLLPTPPPPTILPFQEAPLLLFLFARGKQNRSVFLSFYLIHGLIASSLDADVDHGVGQGATHVELEGQVVNTLDTRKGRIRIERGGKCVL